MNDINKLWVHVSCFGDGNLFAIYPKLLARMLEGAKEVTTGRPDFELLLPSDEVWRTKIYYQLVEKQRQLTGMPQAAAFLDKPRVISKWDTTLPIANRRRTCKLQASLGSSKLSVSSSVSPVTWTVSDIAKAARLLATPSLPTDFDDEQEMRRVYTLIYDVFRYKNVLDQALQDISFFYIFPELRANSHLIWLLFYDLYHRRFEERDSDDIAKSEKLFRPCGLSEADTALWSTRIRLAAAISRLRIAHNAMHLSELLPLHLRDERVAKVAQMAPVTCWVNKNKVESPEDIYEDIKISLEVDIMPEYASHLRASEFRWDPLCPMFLAFHHSQRNSLAKSDFVRQDILIIQNRAFCIGPATLSKKLLDHNLTGSIVQTHISSPRATAYLALLLSENDQIFTLLAFGAGERKREYEEYFNKLNLSNILVFTKRLIDMEPEAEILQQVVAIFATPPNSYSAVNDPVDLVCSRGGDLSMLEILTDTEVTTEGQNRVAKILEEQRLTLRFAMSQPQVQFVLYETHSELSAENIDMVDQVIREVNYAARYKHAELQGKLRTPSPVSKSAHITTTLVPEQQEINNNETDVKGESSLVNETITKVEDNEIAECSQSETKEDLFPDIKVPETDIFEKWDLPELCFNADHCLKLASEGCYVALIQRKEVIRLDAKYMIKMAETRGLFGSASNVTSSKSKPTKSSRQRKKETLSATPVKRKRGTFEIDRIGAQTFASLSRSCAHALRTENGEVQIRCCPRHNLTDHSPRVSPARQWWAETTRYLSRLKKSLLRQKLVSNKPTMLRMLQEDKVLQDVSNIDEILSRFERKDGANIPAFPKLRLTRPPAKVDKEPFPLYVHYVELCDDI